MNRPIGTFLLIASNLISFSTHAQNNSTLTPNQWIEDIEYAANQLKTKHVNPFHFTSSKEFDQAVSLLKAKATTTLSAIQLRLELEKLGAMIGDGHTWISDRFSKDPYQLYPVFFRWFDDGLRVIGIQKDFKELLGYELIEVGGMALEQVESSLSHYIPNAENNYYRQYWEGYWLRNADALHHTGIGIQQNQISYTFKSDTGDIKMITLQSTDADNSLNNIAWAYNPPPMFMRRSQDAIWHQSIPDAEACYIKVNRYPTKKEMKLIISRILSEIELNKPTKIIFDFRMNGGGNKDVVETLVDQLISSGWKSKAAFYAITGDHTFSAALANAVYLREKTNAIIVGEPPTNRPNFYAENLFLHLPNSKVQVSIATKMYKFQEGEATELKMDQTISRKFSDYQVGVDKCLEWILSR